MRYWTSLIANAVWVLGLAVLLSTLSWAHWLARERRARFSLILGAPSCQLACDLGLLLASVGLFFSAHSIWEYICWALFALLYAVLSLQQWFMQRGKGQCEVE